MTRLPPPCQFVLLLVALCTPIPAQALDPAAQVLDVFTRRCADCHGSKADKSKKSYRRLSTIDDLGRLKQNLAADGSAFKKALIDPQRPAASQLLAHMVGADADMPQDDDGNYVPLPAAEQAIVQRWFDLGMPLPGSAEGKPGAGSGQPPAKRPDFIDDEQWLNAILADLQSLPAAKQREARYFTLGHLYNLGAGEARLATQRQGLTKLLNSLSWNATLVRPKLLGEGNSILRVLLSDLDWDTAKWDRLLAIPNNYFVLQGLHQEKQIEQLTGCRMAYVRADWFVFHAAQPPLYHDLLAPRQDPRALDTDAALERHLGIDVVANIGSNRAQRAGFVGGKLTNGSGVSDNNRLLERHPLTKWQGAYWKSYDFAGNAGDHNLFDNPFGPKSIADKLPREQRAKVFLHDGGELIWNLPNGMQAYLLVDGAGKRIDQGPPEIVKDRAESGGLGTNIVNGISCMACHDQGMKMKQDQIRAHVVNLTPVGFTRGERQAVEALYPTAQQMNQLLEDDSKRFLAAAKQLGVDGRDAQLREPVVAAFQAFRNNTVYIDEAAFELGMAPELLKRLLGGELASLRQQLETSGIPRDQFLQSFRRLAKMLRMEVLGADVGGSSQGHASTPSAPATARRGDRHETSIGMSLLFVEPGTFQMGSPPSEEGRDGDEKLHKVTLTKGFWLAETEVTQGQWQAVMQSTPWRGEAFVVDGANVPVSYVSWNDAVDFCNKLTELERSKGRLPAGFGYRLPTEAEWELACRAGSKAAYSFGGDASRLGQFAVFDGSRSGEFAHSVKSRAANAWGFYDMHGNVWEWCADQAESNNRVITDTYRDGVADPICRSGSRRVNRGGCWRFSAQYCRSAFRGAVEPGYRDRDLGFRPALAARFDK